MDSILFAANAKINLALSVIGKRNDSYHELDTVMQTVDISDEISIKKSRFFSFESDSFNGENNIAFKAILKSAFLLFDLSCLKNHTS